MTTNETPKLVCFMCEADEPKHSRLVTIRKRELKNWLPTIPFHAGISLPHRDDFARMGDTSKILVAIFSCKTHNEHMLLVNCL